MADSPIIANEQNEIMWYFLDSEIPTGKLSIIALKQGSVTPTPVLFQKKFPNKLGLLQIQSILLQANSSRYVTTFIWIMVIKYICE